MEVKVKSNLKDKVTGDDGDGNKFINMKPYSVEIKSLKSETHNLCCMQSHGYAKWTQTVNLRYGRENECYHAVRSHFNDNVYADQSTATVMTIFINKNYLIKLINLSRYEVAPAAIPGRHFHR